METVRIGNFVLLKWNANTTMMHSISCVWCCPTGIRLKLRRICCFLAVEHSPTTASPAAAKCNSFLNSCVNPVALYCVSGVFRTHFHRYLCCKEIQKNHRYGMSLANGDTFTSTIRRKEKETIFHNGTSPRQSVTTEKRWGTFLSQDTYL